MEIKLIHPFLWNCHKIQKENNIVDGIDEILKETKKLSTFNRKLVNQSSLYPNRYNPDNYKGDGFELFVEALIKLSPMDNRIGIGKYEPVTDGDTGVDGFGIGIDLKPATVQVKYRSNNSQLLNSNEDHLSNFITASILRYKIDPSSKTNMLIITTAKGLHYFTDNEMFQNKVRCIGYEDLRDMVDNNLLFWDSFRNLVTISKKTIK
jgi:hypothetical protein